MENSLNRVPATGSTVFMSVSYETPCSNDLTKYESSLATVWLKPKGHRMISHVCISNTLLANMLALIVYICENVAYRIVANPNSKQSRKIDFFNCSFDLGYLSCSDDCHPFFQDRNHSQSIESSPALWIANDKASFSWADVMIMSHIKYDSRRPSSYKVCKIKEFFVG